MRGMAKPLSPSCPCLKVARMGIQCFASARVLSHKTDLRDPPIQKLIDDMMTRCTSTRGRARSPADHEEPRLFVALLDEDPGPICRGRSS